MKWPLWLRILFLPVATAIWVSGTILFLPLFWAGLTVNLVQDPGSGPPRLFVIAEAMMSRIERLAFPWLGSDPEDA